MTTKELSREVSTDTDARDVRALTEYLTVLDDTPRVEGADGLFEVVSQSGSAYVVDLELGACDCPDHRYREATCKHLRRVRYALGHEPIPGGVDGVDPDLGRHVDGAARVAVADGGQVVEADADAERPEECNCRPRSEGLACFPCFNAGFEAPNPEATEDEER